MTYIIRVTEQGISHLLGSHPHINIVILRQGRLHQELSSELAIFETKGLSGYLANIKIDQLGLEE